MSRGAKEETKGGKRSRRRKDGEGGEERGERREGRAKSGCARDQTAVLFATMMMPPISIAAYAGDLVLGKRNLSSLLPSASAAAVSLSSSPTGATATATATAPAPAPATATATAASARPSRRDCCYPSPSAAGLAPANYCAAFPTDASLWTCPTSTTTTLTTAAAFHVINPPSHSRSNSALLPSHSRGSSPRATVSAVAGSTSATRHSGLGKHPRSSPSSSMSTHHDGFNPHTAADLLRQAMFSR